MDDPDLRAYHVPADEQTIIHVSFNPFEYEFPESEPPSDIQHFLRNLKRNGPHPFPPWDEAPKTPIVKSQCIQFEREIQKLDRMLNIYYDRDKTSTDPALFDRR